MHIQQEKINGNEKCATIAECPSHGEPDDNVKDDAPKLPDLDPIEEQQIPEGTGTKQSQLIVSPYGNENHSFGPKKNVRRSNQPRARGTKIVVKTSAESIETNDNMLIRLTSYQQSIDAKLDEVL